MPSHQRALRGQAHFTWRHLHFFPVLEIHAPQIKSHHPLAAHGHRVIQLMAHTSTPIWGNMPLEFACRSASVGCATKYDSNQRFNSLEALDLTSLARRHYHSTESDDKALMLWFSTCGQNCKSFTFYGWKQSKLSDPGCFYYKSWITELYLPWCWTRWLTYEKLI